MAQRRGLFRRIFDFVKEVVTPEPEPIEREPPQPPPPPRPPPSGPDYPGPDDGGYLERRFQRAYENIEGTRTGYLDWLDMYYGLGINTDTDSENVYYWEQFLRAFSFRLDDPRGIPRQQFYSESGVPASAIDWQAWREVMGYPARK